MNRKNVRAREQQGGLWNEVLWTRLLHSRVQINCGCLHTAYREAVAACMKPTETPWLPAQSLQRHRGCLHTAYREAKAACMRPTEAPWLPERGLQRYHGCLNEAYREAVAACTRPTEIPWLSEKGLQRSQSAKLQHGSGSGSQGPIPRWGAVGSCWLV